MIRSFRHRGLKRLYEKGDASRLRPDMVPKIRRILERIDVARTVEETDAPGFGLHPLKGALKGLWAISVTGNWRIIFRFEGRDAEDVELIDYH